MRTSPKTLLATAVAPLVALSLTLTACGGDDEPSNDTESSAAPAEPETWPLTGLEVPDGKSADSGIYIAKIDNTASSAPQVGLGKADLVVEELVEGGITRLAAFYQSELPKEVGPVRSMRATDVGIAAPADATIVTSGAAAYTKEKLAKAKIEYVEEGQSDALTRDSGRSSLYSVMADLAKVDKESKDKATRPEDYLPFGDDALPQGQPAKTIDVTFSPARTSRWVFEGGKYHAESAGGSNSGNYMGEGGEFTPDTVIVAKAKVTEAPYTDPGGSMVPETHFEGTGEAMIFHDGTVVRGTWSKKSVDAPVTFSTKAGELAIPPGKVWIELVPGKGVVAPGQVSFT